MTLWRLRKSDSTVDPELFAAKRDNTGDIEATQAFRCIHGVERKLFYKDKPRWHWVDADGNEIPTPPAKQKKAAQARGCRLVRTTERRFNDGAAIALLDRLRYDRVQARRQAQAKEPPVTVVNQNANINGTRDVFAEIRKYEAVFEKLDREKALAQQMAEASGEQELADKTADEQGTGDYV
jgi:hypothetical protein